MTTLPVLEEDKLMEQVRELQAQTAVDFLDQMETASQRRTIPRRQEASKAEAERMAAMLKLYR